MRWVGGHWLAFAAVAAGLGWASVADPTGSTSVVDPTEDSPRQHAMVDAIGEALAGPMTSLTPEEALLVDLDTLYAPLSEQQRAFMEAIRRLEGARPEVGRVARAELVELETQVVETPEGEQPMPLVLLPEAAWRAFSDMNAAMTGDLGRGLRVGSGYRSPANQLFIFVRYMPYYDYSPGKTRPHVSLPGASDHNRVDHQGIDFVSQRGVDLRYSDPEAFRALEEHAWLVENAARFGFVGEGPDGLSPWHWSFSGRPD